MIAERTQSGVEVSVSWAGEWAASRIVGETQSSIVALTVVQEGDLAVKRCPS
jgi:hypothetical protein